MAHKTLIDGTSYEIIRGKTLIDGSVYTILQGKTLVDNTIYNILFNPWVRDDVVNALEFLSDTPFTLSISTGKTWNGTVEYHNGQSWETWDGSTISSGINSKGHCIYLRGTNNTIFTGGNSNLVLTGTNIQCNGNIEYLLDYKKVIAGQHPTMADSCFHGLFQVCTNLVSAPTLPATTLAPRCYAWMFYECTGLTQAPELPSMQMQHECYSYMFYGCTSLKHCPKLPAYNVHISCYSNMFNGCTSLETMTELPSTHLMIYCYYKMFAGCSSLKEVPYLPATTLADHCYDTMFDGAIWMYADERDGYTTEYIIPINKTEYDRHYPDKNDNTTWTWAISKIFTNISGDGHDYASRTDPDDISTGKLIFQENRGVGYLPSNVKIIGKNFIEFYSDSDFTVEAPATWNGTIEYNTGNGWTTWTGEAIVANSNNYSIYLRGTDNTHIMGWVSNNAKYWTLDGTNISCNGNIENLLDYQTVKRGNHPTMDDWCYMSMFYNCDGLIKAPDLLATTVIKGCYRELFKNCSNLIKAPKLPSMKMEMHCYYAMFQDCSSLTKAPELPATTLGNSCYTSMFNGCTSLVTAPALPSTTLDGGWCYSSMFANCDSLVNAPALSSTTLTEACYYRMFENCTNLVNIPSLPATTLTQQCYQYMFRGCSKIILSQTKVDSSYVAYRIPTTGTATSAENAVTDMFINTGGTFTGTPVINTTYYLKQA